MTGSAAEGKTTEGTQATELLSTHTERCRRGGSTARGHPTSTSTHVRAEASYHAFVLGVQHEHEHDSAGHSAGSCCHPSRGRGGVQGGEQHKADGPAPRCQCSRGPPRCARGCAAPRCRPCRASRRWPAHPHARTQESHMKLAGRGASDRKLGGDWAAGVSHTTVSPANTHLPCAPPMSPMLTGSGECHNRDLPEGLFRASSCCGSRAGRTNGVRSRKAARRGRASSEEVEIQMWRRAPRSHASAMMAEI